MTIATNRERGLLIGGERNRTASANPIDPFGP